MFAKVFALFFAMIIVVVSANPAYYDYFGNRQILPVLTVLAILVAVIDAFKLGPINVGPKIPGLGNKKKGKH
ncbi:hypothetical protein BLOT_014100 [Blomia tropicalis]|nr:hypothetical protein BLOT_014100 [Blomia tropicalis]